jgi:large subunit ribosomal protein L5
MTEEKNKEKAKNENPMREIKIEKIAVGIGGTGEYLQKGIKLLKEVTGKKPAIMKSTKRIPSFGVRPGLEVGAVVTLRKNLKEFLEKMLEAEENVLKRKQISENNFSFGVKEYIEIPGMEYIREIGIMGFDVTVVFKRTGKRVKLKKAKRGKLPSKQKISKQEIIEFMEKNFKTEFIGK